MHYLLSHRAGLAALRPTLPTEALFDWQRMTDALAAETPWWEPGSRERLSRADVRLLVGEVVRRVDGSTLGAFFREEVAARSARTSRSGSPAQRGRARRRDGAADGGGVAAAGAAAAPAPESLLGEGDGQPARSRRSSANPPRLARAPRSPPRTATATRARSRARWRRSRAAARLGGVRFLGDGDARARHRASSAYGTDLVLGVPMRWGLGFMLASPSCRSVRIARAFGHGGWGGSLGIADLDARVSWAYVMNKMSPGTVGDTRAFELAQAFYGALAA